jgi:hypothetical protein
MKHLMKRYSCFLGEMLHLGRVFLNFQPNFYHLFNLIHLHLYSEYSDLHKNQQNINFCWFFFVPQSIKNNTRNEEERFNFDY